MTHDTRSEGSDDTVSGMTCNLEGTITHYGSGAEKLFGWSADEVIGKQKVTIFHKPELIATLVPRLLQTAAETGKFEEEVTLVTKGGQEFKAVLTVKPLKEDGKITGYVGMAREV